MVGFNYNTLEIHKETNTRFLDSIRIRFLLKPFVNSCSHQPPEPLERQTITLKEARN